MKQRQSGPVSHGVCWTSFDLSGLRRLRTPSRVLATLLAMVGVGLVAGSGSAADLVTQTNAFLFSGEATSNGSCAVAVVRAPDEDNLFCLRVTFRLDRYQEHHWLDCFWTPAVPLDLAGAQTVRLWFRSEQAQPALTVKIVDPDNPGANHSALEGPLPDNGQQLTPGSWHALDLALPADPARRDGITYVGFYVAAANRQMPVGQDVVFYLGRFTYSVPERPPWPPRPSRKATAAEEVWDEPLTSAGPWQLVGGGDNQTGHLAQFVDGGVEFIADAEGWNEYLWSKPDGLALQPSTTYRLQFDYTVLREPGGGAQGATFYSLVRARGTIKKDVGWQRWQGAAGSRGRRLVTFTTLAAPEYYLNFGIRHHGGIRIENVRVWRVTAE